MTAFVVALGIYALQVILPVNVQPQASPTTDIDEIASHAALNGVEAFFTIDYREGKDAWLKKVCAVSSTSGCQFLAEGIDPLWERIETSKSIATAKVTPIEKVAENSAEQVWVIAIVLSSPLPGSNKTKDQAYVVVEKTEEGWKFDRFLMAAETQALRKYPTMSKNETH
jgi:hypothetical protein